MTRRGFTPTRSTMASATGYVQLKVRLLHLSAALLVVAVSMRTPWVR